MCLLYTIRLGVGNQNAAKHEPETILYNVQDCFEAPPANAPKARTGNTIDAGLRRLTKAAEEGDSRAQMWLDDVLAGKCSTHRACVEMGWRKPTVTISATQLFLDLRQKVRFVR